MPDPYGKDGVGSRLHLVLQPQSKKRIAVLAETHRPSGSRIAIDRCHRSMLNRLAKLRRIREHEIELPLLSTVRRIRFYFRHDKPVRAA